MPSVSLPTMQDMSKVFDGQGAMLSLVLLSAGVIFMLMGLRLYGALIMASFGCIGFRLGMLVPVEGWLNWVCAGIAAVALAAVSAYLMRFAVAVLAGGWAGVATAALVQPMVNEQVSVIAGIAVLIAVVSLTFILFEQIVAFVTSFEGSLIFLCGLTLLMSQRVGTRHIVDGTLGRNGYFAAFLILGGTVIGYYAQMAEDYRKRAGSSS